jgi:hypothetical protein
MSRTTLRGAVERHGLPQRAPAVDGQAGDQAEDDHHHRAERPGGGDAELRAGGRRLGAHPHQPAEEEQVDAVDLEALALGGQRVPQLVEQDRPEGQERGRHRGGVGSGVRPVQRVLERPLEVEDREEQDQEPAVVHAYPDAEQAGQLEGAAATRHRGNCDSIARPWPRSR